MTTEEENRLKEQVAFHRAVKLQEARELVCEAAVEWYQVTKEEHPSKAPDLDRIEAGWKALRRLHEAAKAVAELEEQCASNQ